MDRPNIPQHEIDSHLIIAKASKEQYDLHLDAAIDQIERAATEVSNFAYHRLPLDIEFPGRQPGKFAQRFRNKVFEEPVRGWYVVRNIIRENYDLSRGAVEIVSDQSIVLRTNGTLAHFLRMKVYNKQAKELSDSSHYFGLVDFEQYVGDTRISNGLASVVQRAEAYAEEHGLPRPWVQA